MSGGGPTPSVAITAPTSGTTVNGSVNVSAFAIGASKLEFYLDGVRQFTDIAAPFLWSWNTTFTANGPHTVSVNQPGTYYARVYGYPAGNGFFNPTSAYSLSGSLNGTTIDGSIGTVVSWGLQTIPCVEPGARFTAIAAGWYHSLALKSDGTVVAWGSNESGQSTVPAGLIPIPNENQSVGLCGARGATRPTLVQCW